MELEHEFRVSVPVEQAWAVLTDLERVAPCMPGAELQEVEGDEYPTTQAYVAAGLGVALIPTLGLGTLHEGVRVLRIRGARPVRHVYAVVRPDDPKEGAIPLSSRHSSRRSLPSAAVDADQAAR